MIELGWRDLGKKVTYFMRKRAIKCSYMSMTDFVDQIGSNKKYKFPSPGMDPTFRLSVNWSQNNKSAFYYFWLIEIVFSSLTKHQYLHRMVMGQDGEEGGSSGCGFTFYYATPDWVTPSIIKVSRERGFSLQLNGVTLCTVLDEITVTSKCLTVS